MPERFVRIVRGDQTLAQVQVSPGDKVNTRLSRDKGRNVDPDTGAVPRDSGGEELPVAPEVYTVHIQVPESDPESADQSS